MLYEIIHKAEVFKAIIGQLKKESFYYPRILIKRYANENPSFENEFTIYASTLVRIERDKKWYIVHCVESIVPTQSVNETCLLLKLMQSVHNIQVNYHITGQFEDLDTLQQSEPERLLREYKLMRKIS